jgi:hypothetical protein
VRKVTGYSASTNTRLGQGLGVKAWMQCNTPPTCHAAKSATRRRRFLPLLVIDRLHIEAGQSRPLTALAKFDCTRTSWGFARRSIDEPYLRAELENGCRDQYP